MPLALARVITSLIEEAEAIGWYEQRISLEKDKEAKAIMIQTQSEEFIHFAMDLEFLLRKNKKMAYRDEKCIVQIRRYCEECGKGGRRDRGGAKRPKHSTLNIQHSTLKEYSMLITEH